MTSVLCETTQAYMNEDTGKSWGLPGHPPSSFTSKDIIRICTTFDSVLQSYEVNLTLVPIGLINAYFRSNLNLTVFKFYKLAFPQNKIYQSNTQRFLCGACLTYCKWVSCHHGMARLSDPQTKEIFQMCRYLWMSRTIAPVQKNVHQIACFYL
jgi:hypothetical protein